MNTFWRGRLMILGGFLSLTLSMLNCGVTGSPAVGTLSEAELESMAERVRPAVRDAGAEPELPRIYLETNATPPTGTIIDVPEGGDLQGALNRAQPGDVVTLQAGATYRGNFTLPAKSGSGWIVV